MKNPRTPARNLELGRFDEEQTAVEPWGWKQGETSDDEDLEK